jgi:hypothetical protein
LRDTPVPIRTAAPPKQSLVALDAALGQLLTVKTTHHRWMRIIPPTAGRRRVRYAHPLYGINVGEFLEKGSLSKAMKRTGWVYFLRDGKNNLAFAEVTLLRGKHRNARLSEGRFVGKTFRLIEKTARDVRIGNRGFELRSIRVESLHFYCLWLRVPKKVEYFVPVTPLGTSLKVGGWFSRMELSDALRREGRRVKDAHERARKSMTSLYKEPPS